MGLPFISSLVRALNKPEYFFRPSQLFRRLCRFRTPAQVRFETLQTLWGADLRVCVREQIGFSLWHLGIYDLVVSEVLWRLSDPGERVADLGANLGYMASLLAARVGRGGSVTAFEPHPGIFKALQGNIEMWPTHHYAPVAAVNCAISDRVGNAELAIPEHLDANSGLSYLDGAINSLAAKEKIPVSVTTLDEFFNDSGTAPAVVKIDTEGNEAAVFAGARSLLSEKRIRDIVFEDHGEYPTAAMQAVADQGYAVFRIKKTFFGPTLEDPKTPLAHGRWEATSYLATMNPDRCRVRLSVRGWQVLRAARTMELLERGAISTTIASRQSPG